MGAAARLDSSGPGPETTHLTNPSPERGAAPRAAKRLAKTAAPPAPHDGLLTGVAAKATAAAQRAAGLRADLKAAREIAHLAQVREALSRTELTLALTEALRARAAAQAQLRRQAMQRYLETAQPRPLRQRGRLTRTVEKLLLRLKGPGQAEVIGARASGATAIR